MQGAQAMTRGPQWHHAVDAVQGEQHAWTARGDQVWWDDARSVAQRVALARTAGLAGAAVWRLGGGPALTRAQTGEVERPQVRAGRRPLQQLAARGLVALTFDDGPDPQVDPAGARRAAPRGCPCHLLRRRARWRRPTLSWSDAR